MHTAFYMHQSIPSHFDSTSLLIVMRNTDHEVHEVYTTKRQKQLPNHNLRIDQDTNINSNVSTGILGFDLTGHLVTFTKTWHTPNVKLIIETNYYFR